MNIRTLIPNHAYPAAGVIVNTPGYNVAALGCTPAANGLCLFSVSATTPQTIVTVAELAPNVSTLGLSVLNTALNPALTGHSRQIVITNNGPQVALNISVSASGLPAGTSISATTCSGNLNVGSSCTISVTPGSVPSSGSNGNPCTTGTAPVGGITVSSDNVTPRQIGVAVLGYGCIYQNGYVFSINDAQGCGATCIGSVGGTAAALTDLTSSIIWSSNGTAGVVSFDLIPGIGIDSTPGNAAPSYADFTNFFTSTYPSLTPTPASSFNACNGRTDGICNTNNIVNFYNYIITGIPAYGITPLNTYAAGLCRQYTAGDYAGWYLPSICEMGYQSNLAPISPSGCGTPGNPLIQNMQTSLVDYPASDIAHLVNSITPYWSSSETTAPMLPSQYAWWTQFEIGGSGQDDFVQKSFALSVRCTRALTNM